MRRSWIVYALLLALAVAAALVSRNRGASQSPLASVENTGAAGTRALFLYFEESGRQPLALHAPLTELPKDVRVLVVPPAERRHVSPDEVDALEAFVKGGGTLIYLAPRGGGKQKQMADWLSLEPGTLPPMAPIPGDALGANAEITRPEGLADGLKTLRVAGLDGIEVKDEAATAVASKGALWRVKRGEGEIWIASGADIAENRRIELGDNLAFWENAAARGRIAFDEYHFAAAPAAPMSVAVLIFAAQFAGCGLFFAFARGQRLGPPRPEVVEKQRSTLEYLVSLAWLTRAAKVERELIDDLVARLRVLMQERFGISTALPERDAALELARHAPVPAESLLALFAEARAVAQPTAREYARLSRQFAHLERVITGRAKE